jgi:soluble lytic murein transglycosylase
LTLPFEAAVVALAQIAELAMPYRTSLPSMLPPEAIKYKDEAGYRNLSPDDLYSPEINVAIGSIYIRELKNEFDGMYEAIAASYNAGEDNSARWLSRTRPREPGVFAAEVGFAETKHYVFKVMNNYRVYRDLYDENLNRK